MERLLQIADGVAQNHHFGAVSRKVFNMQLAQTMNRSRALVFRRLVLHLL